MSAGKPIDVSNDVRLQSSGSNASSTSGKSVIAGRRRSSSGKNAPKKSPPTTQADAGTERSSGFLRSLRNIFVRKRRRPVSVVVVQRARSSEALDKVPNSPSGHCSPRAVGLLRQDPTSPTQLDKRRLTSVPYSKVFSVSADDLLNSSQWVIVQTSSGGCSSAENLDGTSSIEGGKASVSSMDDLSSDTEATATEFFNMKWTEHVAISDKPATLNTEAESTRPDDLNIVKARYNLDVTAVKDKLAVKQRGKRQTAVFQQKIQLAAKHSVGAPATGHVLASVAEDTMEDNNDVTAAVVTSSKSAGTIGTGTGTAGTAGTAAAASCYDEHDGHLAELQESSRKTRLAESGNVRSSKPAACLPVPTGPTDRHLAMLRPVINPEQLAEVMRRTGRSRSGSSTPPRDYDVTPRDSPTSPSPLSPRSTDKNRITKELDKVCLVAARGDVKSELEKRIATRHHSGDNKLNAVPTAAAAAAGGGAGVGGKSDLLKPTKPRPMRPETMAPIGDSRNSERAAMFVETEWLSAVQRRTQHWDNK